MALGPSRVKMRSATDGLGMAAIGWKAESAYWPDNSRETEVPVKPFARKDAKQEGFTSKREQAKEIEPASQSARTLFQHFRINRINRLFAIEH